MVHPCRGTLCSLLLFYVCLQSGSNRFWLYFYSAWCFSVFSNCLDDKHGLFFLSENKILILKVLCLLGGEKSLTILHITFPEGKNNKKLPGELGSRSMALSRETGIRIELEQS